MKSAYELAMERLAKQSPTVKLTDEQKRQLSEIDALYRAKFAEREIFLRGQIEKAVEKGDAEEFQQLERQITADRRNLESECEEKKEKIRRGESL
ncbi:MAG: hypothetical protein IT581_18780 [Verrucomicrobiales bacterium]|nr:hypothetical protein [Verrucomicrobiales bacterium]